MSRGDANGLIQVSHENKGKNLYVFRLLLFKTYVRISEKKLHIQFVIAWKVKILCYVASNLGLDSSE